MLVIGAVYWLFSGGIKELAQYFFPLYYSEEITEAAAEYGLDEYLVRAVIKAESGYEENASSGVAYGLMQLTDETAEWVSEKTGLDFAKRLEPEVNIKMGCYYLSYLIERFGSQNTALAAYNAGPATVGRWLSEKAYSKDGESLDKIPYAETEKYVRKVEDFYRIYIRLYEST